MFIGADYEETEQRVTFLDLGGTLHWVVAIVFSILRWEALHCSQSAVASAALTLAPVHTVSETHGISDEHLRPTDHGVVESVVQAPFPT